MPIEIITNFLPVTDDMDLFTKIQVETWNKSATDLKEKLEKSSVLDLDPKDGRKAVITLSVSVEKGLEIKRDFTF